MKKYWLKKLRLAIHIKSQIKYIRDEIHAIVQKESHSRYNEENSRKIIDNVIHLIDTFQDFLSPDKKIPEVSDYEKFSPEEVNLSLAQLLVVFRRTLEQLQETPLNIQQGALEILHSYFIELQGLYDLVFVRRYENTTPNLSLSPLTSNDHHTRYFRCFKFTKQSLTLLKEDGVPDDVLRKLETLKKHDLTTEENFISTLETMLGKEQVEQYRSIILKRAQVRQELEFDPVIHEYRSIQCKDLMNVSLSHHLRVALFDILPRFIVTGMKEFFQRKPRCRRILDPKKVETTKALRDFLVQHPLTEAAKLYVALHRHTMRIADIFFTWFVLRLGRPIFELLVLATWNQTVKDHIVPGRHKPRWQAEHLDLEHDEMQKVVDKNGNPGRIKLSSAFFMQPRVKFRLERFLIFKIRTMTVGDIVRPTELGNWMRQNSPDEFLQFFNIALGDMGILGIRTMPEHEITETENTMWLYTALMNFVPGGMTSPGSIVMRKTNYGLTKAQQLFHEIGYYDPRFKGSSGFIADLRIMLRSLAVLKKGRVGKALEETESFEGKRRGF
jgi:hypothetical protein